jgi:hypothetical protein
MEKNTPLCCNFKCECTLTDALSVIQTHFSKTRQLLDATPTTGAARLLKSLQDSVDELKRQNMEHLKFRTEYARELVEHVKVMQINAVPMHQVALQSLPFLTGKAKEASEQAKKKKSKKKKQKVSSEK